MIDRANETFDIAPNRLIADPAYGSGVMLDWLDQQRGPYPGIRHVRPQGRDVGAR